jgi:hypothetical protein
MRLLLYIVEQALGKAVGRIARIHFLAREEIFLFTTTSILVLRPTQPPIQWIQVAVSARLK